MPISSATRKAGPFSGSGSTGPFAFTFKVFAEADLYVVKAVTSTGIETVLTLTTDYTVSLNADQDTSPGGTITLVSALAVGTTLVITTALAYLQSVDLTNQGGFYPEVITDALDRLTIYCQQLKESVTGAITSPVSDSGTDMELPAATERAGTVLAFDTSGNPIAGPDVDDVGTVLTNIADISTVAGISADVTTAASNVTDITNFADVYYGPSASDPTTRRDGSALQAGDLYFNTGTSEFRVYAGSTWMSASLMRGIMGASGLIDNLKPTIGATANILYLYTKSGGAVADSSNPIIAAIQDATGYTLRTRASAYASGTSTFTLADAAGYWGLPSLGSSQYFMYLYAIWDGAGIVFALSANPNLRAVTTTTTASHPDYMLLEDGSTYTRSSGHMCQLICAVKFSYYTGDSPNYTIIEMDVVHGQSPLLTRRTAPKGECQLVYSSATALLLKRFNGKYLMINGQLEVIPVGGVSFANTGLSANTNYYIYAYMTGGVMTLYATSSGYSVDGDTGIPICSIAPHMTLVGLIRTDGSGQFVDSAQYRYVRSYWNRPNAALSIYNPVDTGLGTGGWYEANTSFRLYYVAFADDVVDARINISFRDNGVTGHNWAWGIARDGVLPSAYCIQSIIYMGYNYNVGCTFPFPQTGADGNHWLACVYLSSGGSSPCLVWGYSTMTAVISQI